MVRIPLIFCSLAIAGSLAGAEPVQAPWQTLHPDTALAPADNPFSGFVPYPGEYDFPHSMEFSYVGLADILVAEGQVDFGRTVEPLLNEIASRGNQAILRLYIDYPDPSSDEKPGMPEYLIRAGVRQTKYSDHGGGMSPDYDDPRVVRAMQLVIAEWGKRHDGDPRIAYIQAGLLGHWGEWHTWPHEEMFASLVTQQAVLKAYAEAFKSIPVLVSQDALDQKIQPFFPQYPMGLHDDNFANETLSPEWAFVPRLHAFRLTERWKKWPVGGEIAPDLQADAWKQPSGLREDFGKCVRSTHASWLLNDDVFQRTEWGAGERDRAVAAAASLGYEFVAHRYRIVSADGGLALELEVQNVGIAPLYHAIPVRIGYLRGSEFHDEQVTAWDLRTLIPGDAPKVWKTPIARKPTEGETLAVVASRPDSTMKPLKFANREQSGPMLALGGSE